MTPPRGPDGRFLSGDCERDCQKHCGRRVASVKEITQPGDYYLNPHGTAGEDDRALWFRLPKDDPERDNSLNRITEPPWTFRECADESIEVRASILVYDADSQPFWHGYLDEGHIWREC